MTPEQQPPAIAKLPELSQLTDEVWTTRRARVLRRANEEDALLAPLGTDPLTPTPPDPALEETPARVPKDSVVARTADSLHSEQPFPAYATERDATAAGP